MCAHEEKIWTTTKQKWAQFCVCNACLTGIVSLFAGCWLLVADVFWNWKFTLHRGIFVSFVSIWWASAAHVFSPVMRTTRTTTSTAIVMKCVIAWRQSGRHNARISLAIGCVWALALRLCVRHAMYQLDDRLKPYRGTIILCGGPSPSLAIFKCRIRGLAPSATYT